MVPLCACAAVLGIDDGHPIATSDDGGRDATVADGASSDDAPSSDDAGPDGAEAVDGADASDASDASYDSALPTLADGAAFPASCDPTVPLTFASGGIFVAAKGGTDGQSCPQATPCATIQHAIGLAGNANAPVPPPIYVQQGTYIEQLTLQSGVQIIGGWSLDWTTHDCTPPTIVEAPLSDTTTVIAAFTAANATAATLSSLTIGSKPSVNPGDTIIGIAATGGLTTLNLSYVGVNVVGGGDGIPGGAGDAGGAAAAACATPSDGGSSTTLGGKGIGADAGWFVDTGFGSMSGGVGGTGGNGMNGPEGAPGSCVGFYSGCSGSLLLCTATDGGVACGGPGQPGCGGSGGLGGVGGGTGGSSVALFVSAATVHLVGGILQAGNGGAGGAGGPGGGGAVGSTGLTGAVSASVPTTCAGLSTSCGASNYETAAGGQPEGHGGSGAQGGPGGDGAGGDSYAIVQIGGSVQHGDAGTTLSPGLPGAIPDGGNGAPGQAAQTLGP